MKCFFIFQVIGTLPPEGQEADIKWTKLDSDVDHKLDGIMVEHLKHKPIDGLINEEYRKNMLFLPLSVWFFSFYLPSLLLLHSFFLFFSFPIVMCFLCFFVAINFSLTILRIDNSEYLNLKCYLHLDYFCYCFFILFVNNNIYLHTQSHNFVKLVFGNGMKMKKLIIPNNLKITCWHILEECWVKMSVKIC